MCNLWSFPVGSVVKNTPAKQETHVGLLGQEDPQKEKMTTHACIFVEKTLQSPLDFKEIQPVHPNGNQS